MIKKLTRFLALVCAGLLIFISAAAQNDAPSNVKVRFRVLGWDDSPVDLNYAKGKNDVSLVISQGSRSLFYDYSGPSVIDFYRIKTGEDGKPVKEIAAQFDVKDAGPWPLVILAMNKTKPGSYYTMVLKDDLESFPAGSYRFANFTALPVVGSLGSETFNLASKAINLIAAQPQSDSTTLFVSLRAQKGPAMVPIYTNNWRYQTTLRTLVFILPSSDSPTGVAARRLMESTQFPPDPSRKPKNTN